jgi:hypothetical protein
MSYPEGYIWEFPGMYSLSIKYGNQNDFYFCAYMALLMIHYHEFMTNNYFKHAFLSIFVMIPLFLMLIFTRGHYFIDLFCALFFGHYFWMMGERLSYLIDCKVFKIPFHKRFPNFPKECWNCKHPINEWAHIGSCNSATNQMKSEGDRDTAEDAEEEREFTY